MKCLFIGMFYVLAFCIGWSLYNPVERNQPKSFSCKVGEVLCEIHDAVDAYYALNRELPRSIATLQQCNMIDLDDFQSFLAKGMTYEITNNCAVVRVVNTSFRAKKDYAAKGISLRQEVVLTIGKVR